MNTKDEGETPTPSTLYTTEANESRKRAEAEAAEVEPADAKKKFEKLLEEAQPNDK